MEIPITTRRTLGKIIAPFGGSLIAIIFFYMKSKIPDQPSIGPTFDFIVDFPILLIFGYTIIPISESFYKDSLRKNELTYSVLIIINLFFIFFACIIITIIELIQNFSLSTAFWSFISFLSIICPWLLGIAIINYNIYLKHLMKQKVPLKEPTFTILDTSAKKEVLNKKHENKKRKKKQ